MGGGLQCPNYPLATVLNIKYYGIFWIGFVVLPHFHRIVRKVLAREVFRTRNPPKWIFFGLKSVTRVTSSANECQTLKRREILKPQDIKITQTIVFNNIPRIIPLIISLDATFVFKASKHYMNCTSSSSGGLTFGLEIYFVSF